MDIFTLITNLRTFDNSLTKDYVDNLSSRFSLYNRVRMEYLESLLLPYNIKIKYEIIPNDFNKEVKEEVKEEIKEDIKEGIKEDIKEDVKEEINERIKEKIKEEVKEEVLEKIPAENKVLTNLQDLKNKIKMMSSQNITREQIVNNLKSQGVTMDQINKAIEEVNIDNLREYVNQALKQGMTKDQIIRSLMMHGWRQEQISKVF